MAGFCMERTFRLLAGIKSGSGKNSLTFAEKWLLMTIAYRYDSRDYDKATDTITGVCYGSREALCAVTGISRTQFTPIRDGLKDKGLLDFSEEGYLHHNHDRHRDEKPKKGYKIKFDELKRFHDAAVGDGNRPQKGRKPSPKGTETVPTIHRNNTQVNIIMAVDDDGVADAVVATAKFLREKIAEILGVDPSVLDIVGIKACAVGRDINEIQAIARKFATKRKEKGDTTDRKPMNLVGFMFDEMKALPLADDPAKADPSAWTAPAPAPAPESRADKARRLVAELWKQLVDHFSLGDADANAIRDEFMALFSSLAGDSMDLCQEYFDLHVKQNVKLPCPNVIDALREAFKEIRERTGRKG